MGEKDVPMTALFSKPKTPPVPAPAPLARQTSSEVTDAGARESLARRLARGRSSTLNTLGQDKDTPVSLATLLGR